MPSFAFRAKTMDGRVVRGTRVSANEGTLARELGLEALFLVHAEAAQGRVGGSFRGPRLKRKDLIAFLVHVGSYVEAGVPLLAALQDYTIPDKPDVDAAIQELRKRLEGGSTFSDAMEAFPTLFTRLHVSMIRAGESSGRLDESLQEVVKLVEWEEDFRGQVKQASTYPVIVLCVVGLVVLAVSTFALPVVIKLLRELNVPLPLPSQIFIALGEILASWGWVMALVLGVGFVAFKLALRRPGFRLAWDTLVLRLPLIGSLATKVALSRFATFFASQYRAGIPIIQVLKECQDITGNARLGVCVRIIREGVEAGGRLAQMAASVGYFPPLVVRMLAIGEEAGNLEKTLGRVSTYFDAEVKAGIKRFFQLLEPLLMVVLAGVVLFVAISILLPIYTLIGNINASVK